MSDAPALLMTGATGFLGSRLLDALLASGRYGTVRLLVRPRHRAPPVDRVRQLTRELGRSGEDVRAVEGDLTEPGLGLDPDVREALAATVTHVVHAGAATAVHTSGPVARAVNVDGTRRLLDLAGEMERLARLDHVSSALVAGTRTGVVDEDELERNQEFATAVDRSKYETERLVRRRGGLPTAIHRPSFLVPDRDPGLVGLRLLAEVLRSVRRLSGDGGARLDIVPVGWVARAIATLTRAPGTAGACFHLTAGVGNELPANRLLHTPLVATLDRRPRGRAVGFELARKVGVSGLFSDSDWRAFHESATYRRYLEAPGPRFDAADTHRRLRSMGVEVPWD